MTRIIQKEHLWSQSRGSKHFKNIKKRQRLTRPDLPPSQYPEPPRTAPRDRRRAEPVAGPESPRPEQPGEDLRAAPTAQRGNVPTHSPAAMNSSLGYQGGGQSGRQAGPYPGSTMSPPPKYNSNSATGGQGMSYPPNPGHPAQAAQQVASRGVGATMQHGLTQTRNALTNVSNNLTNAVNSNEQVQNMETDPYVAATIMASFLACT